MHPILKAAICVLIPFLGTSLGAACVFLLKKEPGEKLQKVLLGFAAGVMVAASIWSSLIPAFEASTDYGKWIFLPSAVGLVLGMGFLFLLDNLIPHLHLGAKNPEGVLRESDKKLQRTTMLSLAVTLHNIPEGLAPGILIGAALQSGNEGMFAGALALCIGMAIQNFPEGAVVSMPLAGEGNGKGRAFGLGVLSGAVEPVTAVIAIFLMNWLGPVLPYALAFAAGAMLYVVVEELIPEASSGKHSNVGTLGFGIGFLAMMILEFVFA